MPNVKLQAEDSFQQVAVVVRCGVCRDKSIDRRGDRQADLLGRLVYWPRLGFDWTEFRRFDHRQEGLRRASLSSPEHWGTLPFRKGADFGDVLRAQCRHGHDLRVSRDRVLNLSVSADGVLYLPGD